MNCDFCGISGSKTRILEAISLKGVLNICENCSIKENLPLLKKPTTFQLKDTEKAKRVSDVLSSFKKKEIKENSSCEDISLKDIVDKNYEKSVEKNLRPRPDLVDNFHWVIMRARRLKKMTSAQLAREISESETAIKFAEKGILPEDDYRLVNKLESFLGIKILKNKVEDSKFLKKQPARILDFSPNDVQNLTIADLQKMKKEREEGDSNFFSECSSENKGGDEDSKY